MTHLLLLIHKKNPIIPDIPLVNGYGEVFGVNTLSLPGDEVRAQNLNFAISIVHILRSLNSENPVKAKNTNSCGNIVEKGNIFKFW